MPTSLDAIYPLAERQAAHFTTRQAHVVGVSHQQLHYLSRSGSIERVAHGIYRLERFPPQPFEDMMIALLWVGDGSVASHDTALVIYGLTDAMPPVIHVTVPRRFRGKRKGVVVHQAPVPNSDRTLRHGIPVTSLPRTVDDIASRHGATLAAEAARKAIEQGITTRARLVRELVTRQASNSVAELLEGSS